MNKGETAYLMRQQGHSWIEIGKYLHPNYPTHTATKRQYAFRSARGYAKRHNRIWPIVPGTPRIQDTIARVKREMDMI